MGELAGRWVQACRTSTRSFAYDLEGNQTEAGTDRFTYALDHTMTSYTLSSR